MSYYGNGGEGGNALRGREKEKRGKMYSVGGSFKCQDEQKDLQVGTLVIGKGGGQAIPNLGCR